MILSDFIDWEFAMDQGHRSAGPKIEVISGLFEHTHLIASHEEGSYHGSVCVVLLFAPPNPNIDPKVLLITDHFGSCGGCDVWDGAGDDTVKELVISIANNARQFDSFDDLIQFLGEIKVKLEKGSYGEYYDLHKHVQPILAGVKKAINNGEV